MLQNVYEFHIKFFDCWKLPCRRLYEFSEYFWHLAVRISYMHGLRVKDSSLKLHDL